MPVLYDSKKIIPAPPVSLRKEYQTTDDGTVVGTTFVLTVRGVLLPHKGSPNKTGVFWTLSDYPPDETVAIESCMSALIRKQEALRSLFAAQGRSFEVQGWDGAAPLKCNPRVRQIEFAEGGQGRVSWVDRMEYVITLEADVVYVNGQALGEDGDVGSNLVTKASEDWQVEAADDRAQSYRLTHTVSATGKRFYDDAGNLPKQAWENARDYCLNKIGLGLDPARLTAAGVLDASSLVAYNYIRSQSVGELSGNFSVTETWLCFDPGGQPPAVEEYTIQVRESAEKRVTVSVDGTLTGLEVRDNTTHALVSERYANALSKWTTHVQNSLLTRAEAASGVTMNASPLNVTVGHNEKTGVVTYHYEYDDRPDSTISGAISETVNLTDNHQADIFAEVVVLGRPLGPVLQGIGTRTARKRTVQIEAVMRANSQTYTAAAPNTNGLVLSLTPAGSQVYLSEDREEWSANSGRYARSVAFTWEA